MLISVQGKGDVVNIETVYIHIPLSLKKTHMVLKFLQSFIEKIGEVAKLSVTPDQAAAPGHEAALLIKKSKEELDSKLTKIGKSLDWDEPTIAFYGETNAGKSTLIEALRTLFNSSSENRGSSIGDGSPDYTREATSYPCQHGDTKFTLVDVPGIEGDEAKVITEIERAINRAHAVFYVTADPRPPQGGDDEEREGTLEKIRRQLKPQAKVWAVYNKKMNNPRQIGSSLATADETQSLSDGPNSLDGKMSETLGSHYQGHIVLSALPGFLALADDLSPDNRFAYQRAKFLKNMRPDDLLTYSNVGKFGDMMIRSVPSQEKIIEANIQKLVPPVEEAADYLDTEANTQFAEPASALAEQIAKLKPQLEIIANDAGIGIRRLNDELTNGFIKRVREAMLIAINNGLAGDDVFKEKLEEILNNEKVKFPDIVKTKVHSTAQRAQQSCKEALHLVKKHLSDVNAFDSPSFSSSFAHAVKADTNSGVDGWGLAGVGVGGIALLFNPVTGPIVTLLGVIGVGVSLFMSLRNYFNSDYKKDQQKQALNKNIDEMKPKIRSEIADALAAIEKDIQQHVMSMLAPLRNVEENLQKADQSMRQAATEFRKLCERGDLLRKHLETLLPSI